MKFDLTDFESKLATLTGRDFENSERIERQKGNVMPMITFSAAFQARLAALALKTNPEELKDLPVSEYTAIINRTANFLFQPSAEIETLSAN